MTARQGLTLVELLIVLAILAMMAGLLVTSTDGMMDRARVDETERRGRAIVEALACDREGTSPFVADMGRPPVLTSPAPGEEFAELWQKTGCRYEDGPYSAAVAWGAGDTGTTHMSLACGWRGPYITVHGDKLHDGWPEGDWGLSVDADGDWQVDSAPLPATGDGILKFRSYGADGAPGDGETWADRDRLFPRYGTLLPQTASLLVSLQFEDGGSWPNVEQSAHPYVRVILAVPHFTEAHTGAATIRAEWESGAGAINRTFRKYRSDGTTQDTTVICNSQDATEGKYHKVCFKGLMPGPRLVTAYSHDDSDLIGECKAPTLVLLRSGQTTEVTLRLEKP